MNGLYTEAIVKKKTTAGDVFLKILMIAAAVILFLALVMFPLEGVPRFIVMALFVGDLIAIFILMPRFNVDYEYIFCDGQFDFDQISGGEKRKHKLRVDMDGIEIMAPEKSHALDSYRNNGKFKVVDFSSHQPDAKKWCLYVTEGPERLCVIFEPSEKMIDMARQKSPRKVHLD